MKKVLLSVTLCAVLTNGILASAPPPDEATSSAVAPAPTVDPVIAKAKEDNRAIPFLTFHQFASQEIFTYMFAAGKTEELGALLATCCKLHTQLSHFGVRTAFRGVLRTHPQAARLNHWMLHKDSKVQHLIWARQMLRPENIKRLEGDNLLGQLIGMPDKAKALALAAHANHLFTTDIGGWSQERIIAAAHASSRPLSAIAALGSTCREHLFTKDMEESTQTYILIEALKSSLPLSEIANLGTACKHPWTENMDPDNQLGMMEAALQSNRTPTEVTKIGTLCKHLFTKKMSENEQIYIIKTMINSPLSLPLITLRSTDCKKYLFTDKMNEYNKLILIKTVIQSCPIFLEMSEISVICRKNLFTDKMDGQDQTWIITNVLPLTLTQVTQLLKECRERSRENPAQRTHFITERAKELWARHQ